MTLETIPHDPSDWERASPHGPHVVRTLGWRVVAFDAGTTTVAWEAGEEHSFPGPGGPVVHGGLLAALLDNALASAAYTLTGPAAVYLTADLHVQMLRSARPGLLTARAEVVRSGRTAAFCTGRITDAADRLLATATATQVRAG